MSVDELFYETLVLRTAFEEFALHCCRDQTIDGCDLDEMIEGMDRLGLSRSAALLYAHQHADSIEGAIPLVEAVRDWARQGRRPRAMKDAVGPEQYRRIQAAFERAGGR